MAASRSNFAYSIEDDKDLYGSFSSTGSIQDEAKTESCIGAACKKLSKLGKNIKKRFTRKRKKSGLLPRMSDLDKELRYSDLSDYKGSFAFGGRRKRRRRRTRKKKGGKRRRTRKKKRKRHKKKKTRKKKGGYANS